MTNKEDETKMEKQEECTGERNKYRKEGREGEE
jgi:hypothetical protein